MAKRRIGILTGGGDVPGLNFVIKSVVYRGSELGYEVTGIRRGWEGLTHVDLNNPASRAKYILPGGASVNSETKEPVSMWLMTQRQKRRRSRIDACLFLQPVTA